MKIIAFTGMPFSGKSEAVKIAKEMDIPIIRMGDMVWDETKNQNLEINDKNVGMVANRMREKHGMGIWAKKTLEKVKTLGKTDFLVIDGLRNSEEIDLFKKELGKDFVVVAVTAPDEIRHQRAMNRDRKDDSKDIKKIKERDNRELSWGLGKVIESANIVIVNNGTVEKFQKRIEKIFDEI